MPAKNSAIFNEPPVEQSFYQMFSGRSRDRQSAVELGLPLCVNPHAAQLRFRAHFSATMRGVRPLLSFLLLIGCQCGWAAAAQPLICSSGGPVGTVDLRVVSGNTGDRPLPLRTINRLEEGETLTYKPVLRPKEVRKGEVDVVLVPAKGVTTSDKLLVLDEEAAERPEEWKVPWRVGIVAFVYGPQGLSVRKVRGFLSNDVDVVGELADYAEKTSKTEALLAALATPDVSSERLNAALQGFSSQYGLNVQLARNATTDAQAYTAFQALNPAVANYDPLAPQPSASAKQAAMLATSVGELFFGTPVGLAAGGTALLLDLRSLAFPNSEFRSSFSQAMPDDALGLCGKTGSVPPHTRVAYLWAMRVPNAGAPAIHIDKDNSLPAGEKSPLPITVSDASWKILDRARDWTLQPEKGKPVAVKVQTLGDTKKLQVDLSKVTPGKYTLHGNWDWDHFDAAGFIEVRSLSDFATARIVPASQDRLVTNSGKVTVTLDAGDKGDFEFVTKVQIERLHDEFASPSTVPFILPQGLRAGVQQKMDAQIDTSGLDPGPFKLIVSQVDGKPHDITWNLLPSPPSLENLPIVVNQGVTETDVVLKGHRLDLIQRLEAPKGSLQLDSPVAGQTERGAILRVPDDARAGSSYALLAYVEGHSEPLQFADALKIVGPRPAIIGVQVGSPPQQVVSFGQNELPAGGFDSAMIEVKNLDPDGEVRLACSQNWTKSVAAHLGGSSGGLRTQPLAPGQVFVSFDTAGWPNGCVLTATIANGDAGASAPYVIGRIVLLPEVDTFDFQPAGDGSDSLRVILTGENLETIQKAGWTADQSEPVEGLPLPIGDGRKEQLQMRVPAPPDAEAQLLLWLRTDDQPRRTTIRPIASN
jgi:hypothetical protein